VLGVDEFAKRRGQSYAIILIDIRWITSHPAHLTEDEQAQLNKIKARNLQLSATASHVAAFAEMMTGRHGEHLPAWIAAVERDDLPHLHSFVRGIRRDQPAVFNGLTLPYSSGAVEGNICRVKALKRQMNGRANLDLLRKENPAQHISTQTVTS
jgi:transposase